MRKLVDDDRVLVCRIRGGLCALPLAEVVETMRPLPTEPVTGAPAFVSGLAIIRGSAVPVVETARLLADADAAPPSSPGRYVTVDTGTRLVALSVEDVVGVRTISTASRATLPPLLQHAAGAVIDTVAALDAELLVILRAARLLPAGSEWAAADGALPAALLDTSTSVLEGEPR